MRLKKLVLSKEYAKSLEVSFSIVQDSFENALQQAKHFYLIMYILQEKTGVDQITEDGKLASIRD